MKNCRIKVKSACLAHLDDGSFKRVLKMAQYSLVFLFFSLFQVMAIETYSQTRVTMSFSGEKLENVLEEIEKNSEFFFLYNRDLIDADRLITTEINNNTIEEAIRKIFRGTKIRYAIFDRQIVLTDKEFSFDGQLLQEATTGKVVDEFGQPLMGVTIIVKGTKTATVSDIAGNFSFQVLPEDAVLVFSYIGMQTKEIVVANQKQFDVVMQEDAIGLDEVVAIGYGTLSKRNVSGSITNVTEEDFNQGVNQTAAELLQGRVAGLVITTESGDVTAEPTIRLRGTSSLTGSSAPFIVIDGVPGMEISSVAPQDIESISVLKDASAVAIYGSRAASGVILITTKKGKPGQTNVQFNTYGAADIPANLPDVLTAQEWREYTEDLDVTGLDLGANTNWFKEITRTGFTQNHNLSISGGLEDGNYRMSINYLNREGIMRDNRLERYNLLFSLQRRILNDKVNLSLSGGSVLSNNSPSNNYNVVLAYNMLPVYPVKNDDGSWFSIQEFDQGNPVHNIAENSNLFRSSILFGNIKADVELFRGFTLGTNLFKQRRTSDNGRYNAITTQAGRQNRGYAFRGNELWDKDLYEFTLEYSREFNQHDLNILAGYSYEYNSYQSVGASNRTFITDDFGYNNLGAGENLFPSDVDSYRNMNKLISMFGRINYVLNKKYILTAALRRDGSSKFGDNQKWGIFPSFSGAWRISDEAFLQNSTVISDLKLRVGYGVVGNQNGIDPYTSIALYARSDQYFENGNWRNSYRYAQNDNPDLKWEETASLNPGLDFSLFDYRVRGSFDYYIKETSDLLYVYNVPVPPYLYPTMLANVGDISNRGYEVELSMDWIKSDDFKWTTTANFAQNKNKIEKLSNDLFQTDNIRTGTIELRGSGNLTSHIIEEGREVGTFYNLRSSGLDEDGKFIIDDINNDGIINNLDYTYIGQAMPNFTYGFLNSFSIKNFDISVFLRGVYGNDIINSPRIQYSNPKWLPGGNVFSEVLTNGITDDPLFSSYFVEDGSFLRMENLSLAYNIYQLENIGIKKLRIYGTAQNLFVITPFSGPDPEVRMSGLDPGKLDQYFIPKPKTFSLGIEFNF